MLFLLVSFGLSLLLSKTLLNQWFDPSYAESENLSKIMRLSDAVDSLSAEVRRKDLYVANIGAIISGEEVADTIINMSDSSPNTNNRKTELSFRDPSEGTKAILDEFRGAALEFNNSQILSLNAFGDTFFFPPIKGVVTAVFEPINSHFGTDIVAKENEPVSAIADGSVIFTSWTLETGYVVTLQHSNELISIYKHNSVILKRVGDVVKGGEIISIIGNTGELTSGQHLHFEMWYKGTPLNPQEFITFD